MSDTNPNLGAELQQLSHLLEVLIIKEPDLAKAKQLSEKHQEVLNIIRVLVSANVDAATAEYAKATEGVEKANGEVLEAIKDLAKVAKTINTVAKVIDILGKLAKVAGL